MLSRKIESLQMRWWIALSGAIALLCSMLYFWLSSIGEGIAPTFSTPEGQSQAIAFFDCLYFSVVTLSSLGYGDFRPVGYGRVVAGVEVTLGLVLIAIIVSKLASERTSSYVRLLYTSDSERRLKEFNSDVDARAAALRAALRDHNHEAKLDEIQSLGLMAVNIAKYYRYQVKVGALGEDWARKNSLRVVRAIIRAAEALATVGKADLVTTAERNRIETSLRHVRRAVQTIANNHSSEDFTASKAHLLRIEESYHRAIVLGRRKASYSEVTPYVLAQVRAALPRPPWPRDVHKDVARRLRISNRLAHKAITLIARLEPVAGSQVQGDD